MNDTKVLIEKIKEGIQEKKGKNIVIADLTKIEDTICKYFVICQGNSPSQVSAIVDSIKESARKGADSKPFAVDGLRNAEWVAMYFYRKQEPFIILNTFGLMPNLLKSPI